MSKKDQLQVPLHELIEGLPEGTTLRLIDIDDVEDDPRNANAGTEEGDMFLDASFAEHGAGRSVLLDKDDTLIAGNKSREAARANGIQKMLVVSVPDGNTLVGVQREDMDLDDPDTGARRLAYQDNRAAQLNLRWDDRIISKDGDEMDLTDIFTPTELAAFNSTGFSPPSLDELEDDFDDDMEDRDYWPIARVQVSPQTYFRFVKLMEHLDEDGDEAEAFAALLDQVPIETPPYVAPSGEGSDEEE